MGPQVHRVDHLVRQIELDDPTVLTIKQVRPPNALPLARVPCRVAAACERLLESARRGVTAVLDMDLRADEFDAA